MLGQGRTLGPEELRERREEGSRHVDREVVKITDKYMGVTEALGRREGGGMSGSSGLGEVVGSSGLGEVVGSSGLGDVVGSCGLGEVSGSCGLASSLQATLGRSSGEEGEEYSQLDSQASLHVGRGIVKTTNKSVSAQRLRIHHILCHYPDLVFSKKVGSQCWRG